MALGLQVPRVMRFAGLSMLIVCICTSLSPASAATTARTCDSSILPSCQSLANENLDAKGSSAFGTPRDGGAIYNGSAYFAALESSDSNRKKKMIEQIEALTKLSIGRLGRAKVVAEKVRASAVDYIKSQMPEGPERKALIARLMAVEIDTDVQPDETCGSGTLPGFPNASYMPQSNKLYICTAAANATEVQLTRTLTHEMGHVISPCQAFSSVFAVNADEASSAQVSNCSEDLSRYNSDMTLKEEPNALALQLITERPKTISAPAQNSTIRTLVGCGIVKEIPNLKIASNRLFSETADCLVEKFKKSFEETDEFKNAFLTNQMSKTKAHAQLKANGADVCALDVEEAFADRFGASLLGHLSQTWSETDFKIALTPLTSLSCGGPSQYLMTKYEPVTVRLATVLTEPHVSERLRCESPKGAPSCPFQFSSPRLTSKSKTPASKPASKPTRTVK